MASQKQEHYKGGKGRKHTRTGRVKNPGPTSFEPVLRKSKNSERASRKGKDRSTGVSEQETLYYDSSEDNLMEVELARLAQSGGEALPLWAGMEEFRGIT